MLAWPFPGVAANANGGRRNDSDRRSSNLTKAEGGERFRGTEIKRELPNSAISCGVPKYAPSLLTLFPSVTLTLFLDIVVSCHHSALVMSKTECKGRRLLRQKLDRSGLSYSEAGRRARIGGGVLSRLLAGHRDPAMSTAIKIRDAFGVPIEAWGQP